MPVEGARNLPRIALDLLTDIELAESALLTWGVVDGSFTEDELDDLARKRLGAAFDSGVLDVPYGNASEVTTALKEHGLLFELPQPDLGRYRSRTAEAVRLFFRLKQLLPRHAVDGTWRTARDLVADYRLILRPRQFPQRHLTPNAVEAQLAACGASDRLSRKVVRALLGAEASRPLLLADFQVRAADRILGQLAEVPHRAGTMVCAGTGSGKTLAFYLPAMILLARLAGPERWTRCLAIYPRNELLKDQLSSALLQVRMLNQVLAAEGRCRVSIGAMFGDVPKNSEDEEEFQRSWERVGAGAESGWACPHIACPQPGCERSSLVWRDTDRKQKRERLYCDRNACSFVLEGDEFPLTRTSMVARPPDLLFTGLEMVNQALSSLRTRHLFGVGVDNPEQRPQLVLLDEAHTYSGSYGAQAALLLRRWKRASMAVPHFVGLSATLEDARRFFAELIGEPESRVLDVAPHTSELENEGQEVLLALRGDPVSKASLLSTSIQSALLLRRVLDPTRTEGSLFGSKVFAFTDDLDVTNRLFHSLLDAEGWEMAGNRPRRRRELPLAALRGRTRMEHAARFQMGQSWDLVEDIGHDLGDQPAVRVGRTSSQDTGVDRDADTIVATASLEVGFDDPDVGAVLQHKAPRDTASFLQRKGRAGRQRGTRPWTVVVLSDYGRDRSAYQGYEQLFSPQLRPRYLPVRNRYILRMQAVFALVDWLTAELVTRHGEKNAWLWPALAQPPRQDAFERLNQQRLIWLRDLAREVLEGGVLARQFARYLEQALSVGPDVVEQLLWAPPRSLMLAVLPTLARRLDRFWMVAVPDGAAPREEPSTFWSPLPEFVPGALFNDLNLPEVAVSLPPHGERDVERMPIQQALREFAPGRVSRRFGVSRSDVSHWLPVPEDGGPLCFVDDFCPNDAVDELGTFRIESEHGPRSILCLRPRHIRVSEPPQDVSTTSNARLIWASQILPSVEAAPGELPGGSPWRALVRSVGFHAHGYGNAVEVRRFALGSQYDLRVAGNQSISGTVEFARRGPGGGRAVGLGYAIDADAIRVEIDVPERLHLLARRDPALVRALRAARFNYVVQHDSELDGIANSFERGWLIQICLSALILEAAQREVSLQQAVESVFETRALVPLEQVLEVIFQSIADEATDAVPDDRRTELAQLLRAPLIQDSLRRATPSLWLEPEADWDPWLRERLLSTLGAAILDACQQACPDVDAGDLCVDIHPGPRGPEEGCNLQQCDEVWLSETSAGGSGVVEAVCAAYALDPRRFFSLVEAALAPSDLEEVDAELSTLVNWLSADSPAYREDLAQAVHALRGARTHQQTVMANDELRSRLEFAGTAVTHPVLVAMQARVIRPGSSPNTDELLAKMVDRWTALEARLGVEVDARVVAYTMSFDNTLDLALPQVSAGEIGTDRNAWRYSTLYGLLWPRGADVRSQTLTAYNPFSQLPPTERLLVRAVLPATTSDVPIEASDWHQRVCTALINEGAAVLSATPECRHELRRAVQRLLVDPLDTDTLLVQPALAGITHENHRLIARFEVREGMQ